MELLETPRHSGKISEGQNYEDRLKLHVDWLDDSELQNNFGYKQLIDFLSFFLQRKKAEVVVSFITNPIYTNKLISKVKDQLKRVFDAKNQVRTIEMFNPEMVIDAKAFLAEVKADKFTEEEVYKYIYSAPCTVVVVDAPLDGGDPYFLPVKSESITDINWVTKDEIDYIVFRNGDTFYFYDDENYNVFQFVNGDYIHLSTSSHDLERCPADHISPSVTSTNLFLRWSPVAEWINELNWIVTYEAFRKIQESYVPFPIIASFSEACNYKQNGERCERGFKVDSAGYKIQYSGNPVKCPICEEKSYLGPGSLQKSTAPASSDETSLIESPRVVEFSIDGVQRVNDRINELNSGVFEDVTGKKSLVGSREAINEKQVQESIEAQKSVLNNFKKVFEAFQNRSYDLILRFKFGDSFVSINNNLGSDFVILSENEATLLYEQLKKIAAPEEMLSFVYLELLESRYKDDKNKLEEAVTLFNLNPWPHKGSEEVLKLDAIYPLDFNEITIKLNFTQYISRLKREVNLSVFGTEIPFDQKINLLKDIMINYGNEKSTGERRGNDDPGGGAKQTNP